MGLLGWMRSLASVLGDDGAIYDIGDGRDLTAGEFRAAAFSRIAAHIRDIPVCAAGFERRRRQTLMMASPFAGGEDDVDAVIDELILTSRCGCGLKSGFALVSDERGRRVLRRVGIDG